MIKYIDELYLTENTEKKLNKIKYKLKVGAGMTGYYVIMLAKNNKDVFEIVPIEMFKQRRYRRLEHIIVGFADDKMSAYHMVESIILDIYNKDKTVTSYRNYFTEMAEG